MKETLTEQDFIDAATLLGCEIACVKAVAEVESGKSGGFCPDDFPVILFEGHIFSRYTNGLYSRQYPTISYPKWTRQFYGKTWQEERGRLESATALNRNAALMSASWGRFQIMGFNHGICGYVTVQQFVNAMCKSEREQGRLFVEYIIHEGLTDELRERRWDDFARFYNGPLYTMTDYAGKLARAYKRNGGTL
jgi:hypothetical protein